MAMTSGIVKWFSNQRGFGFILHPDADVFVHHSAILGTGYKTLDNGEEVTYELETTPKGLRALNVCRRHARNSNTKLTL